MAEKLICKVEENLTNKFYRWGARNVCKMRPIASDEDMRVKENLRILSQAIADQVQIEMTFCGYGPDNRLDLPSGDKTCLSPYYIVADGGRYYLLCAYERSAYKCADDTEYDRHMYFYRIDLMADIRIPGQKNGRKGIAVTPKHKVRDLPQEWNDDFFIHHMNMAYGNPRWIKLRVSIMRDGKKLPLTFLHDSFGGCYRVEDDPEDGNYKIIRVRCAEFAIVNWALQYSDRVEVLEPQPVRDAVKDRVRKLAETYAVEK